MFLAHNTYEHHMPIGISIPVYSLYINNLADLQLSEAPNWLHMQMIYYCTNQLIVMLTTTECRRI